MYVKVFVPGRPFQPSLMFVGKAKNKSIALERCVTKVGPGLTLKH